MNEITSLFHAVVKVYTGATPGWSGQGMLRALGFGSFFFCWVLVWERHYRTRTDNYRSRNFLHDVAYWFYLKSGLHYFIFMAALVTWSQESLSFLDMHPFIKLPIVLQWVLFFFINDLTYYWVHRALHHFKFLWAFHATHHSQEKLTFVSGTRTHPVEQIIAQFSVYVAARLAGFNEMIWLPLTLVVMFQIEIEHSGIPWRFGPFYKLLVSPVFHNFHHSIDPAHRDKNFGGTFSCWDYLFGTAVKDTVKVPTRFGVEGVTPTSLWGTLVVPFRLLRESYGTPVRKRVTEST